MFNSNPNLHSPAFARRVLDGAFERIDLKPHRFVYRCGGEWVDPATLEPFADPDVIAALNACEVRYCVVVIGAERIIDALDRMPKPSSVRVRHPDGSVSAVRIVGEVR